jgi:AcrR family transcriptional regulator
MIIEAAERLFRQKGFQKTTIADIARELQISPANIYRFFTTKSEINEAVCMDLLGKIEAEAEKIAASSTTVHLEAISESAMNPLSSTGKPRETY